MPLIAKVGRKAWPVRLLFAVLYGLLIGGGLTMVYPFLMMLSNSVTSNADWKSFRLVPKYFFDRREQFRKLMVEAEHEQEIPWLFGHNEWFGSEDIRLDALDALVARDPRQLARIADDWRAFMRTISVRYWRPYFNWQGQLNFTPFVNCLPYRDFLRARYTNDISALNRAHGSYYTGFDDIWHMRDGYWRRLWAVPDQPQWHDWIAWKATLDPLLVYPYPMELEWWKYVRYLYVSIERFNERTRTNLASLIDVHLDDAIHHGVVPREHVENFVFEKCNSMYYVLHASTAAWHAFIVRDFEQLGTNATMPRAAYLRAFPPDTRCPTNTQHYALWTRYINEKQLGPDGEPVYARSFGEVEVWSPVHEYRQFLRVRYTNDIAALNAAYGPMYLMGRPYASFDEIRMLPVPENLYYYFLTHHRAILRTYIAGNYGTVIRYVATRGRAFWNTIVLIVLSIASTLTINPMAAYALSRYRLSYANKILIFFLATMAFPAEVGMIPNFLMIRDLGLLNTFGALVLPGLANGFGIFLLKGFFDSLPPELYEAALIDGASEWTMFWRITLPLCKPILAVMALGAFAGAYGAFMFAFLVCQDQRMWTLMVFLYQFQQTYGNYMIMASLVITAIPTLIVFVLCQRVILRGIVIPTFK